MAGEPTEHLDLLEQKLASAGLEVDRVGNTMNLERGGGSKAVAANIDPVDFLDELHGSSDDRAVERDIAGYARGVHHSLLEPEGSDAADSDFAEAAGDLLASVEPDAFREGVAAVTGSPAYAESLTDALSLVFVLELDFGIRTITREQFDRWTATEDRVASGARSILFHKAQQTSPEPFDGDGTVERLAVGDGWDAARILVVDDLFYGQFDDPRFALPTSEHLLFVRDSDDRSVQRLREAARDLYDRADFPLSARVFRTEDGRPEPVHA